ncbi:hypothetical protein C8Q80DRAFT_411548 [Daedaleopsis nitida]|nr:hypothetical protein C8Q80DRAFT_411548 [Daedaleopsis nitida]
MYRNPQKVLIRIPVTAPSWHLLLLDERSPLFAPGFTHAVTRPRAKNIQTLWTALPYTSPTHQSASIAVSSYRFTARTNNPLAIVASAGRNSRSRRRRTVIASDTRSAPTIRTIHTPLRIWRQKHARREGPSTQPRTQMPPRIRLRRSVYYLHGPSAPTDSESDSGMMDASGKYATSVHRLEDPRDDRRTASGAPGDVDVMSLSRKKNLKNLLRCDLQPPLDPYVYHLLACCRAACWAMMFIRRARWRAQKLEALAGGLRIGCAAGGCLRSTT